MHFTGEMSREVLCRISPDTRILEILSRPGLGHTAWQTHATAKIIVGADYSEPNVGLPHDFIRQIPDEIFISLRMPQVCSLDRRSKMSRAPACPATIGSLSICARGHPTSYWLDPARLDSCFHGIRRL
jgi:phthiocerol/phenolphthiocerol synthesis type-I polyketide synthase C